MTDIQPLPSDLQPVAPDATPAAAGADRRTARRWPVAPVAWATGVLVATMLVGAWASFSPAAPARLVLLLAGVALMWLVAQSGAAGGEGALELLSVGCALLAAAIGIYFVLTYDWAAGGTAKFAIVQQAGLWIQAHRPAIPVPDDINGNVAGGALAVLIPLGLGAVGRRTGRRAAGLRAIAALATAVAMVALLLTASRGAWIGLAAGGAVAGFLAWRRRQNWWQRAVKTHTIHDGGLLAAAALALAGLFWAAVALPGFDRLFGGITAAGGAAVSRASLWRDMLALAGDYPFTGGGLGSVMMLDATYVRLLHVGFISHAHNLFLQIALEQGLPGLAAFVSLLGIAFWRLLDGTGDRFQIAAAAALTALAVHGMADAGLYASRLAPIIFLPIGMALAAGGQRIGDRNQGTEPRELARKPGDRTLAHGFALAVTAIAALVFTSVPVRASFLANLGALAQSRAELAVYRWPQWPIQDALRRDAAINLAPAIARYQAALALDAENITANRRLGQIELSRGAYAAAREHLLRAYAVAPEQRAVRQLLGESYAIAGDAGRAADLWRTIDLSQGQLAGREWWYDHIGEGESPGRIEQARALASAPR